MEVRVRPWSLFHTIMISEELFGLCADYALKHKGDLG